jgi:hypothetical protein
MDLWKRLALLTDDRAIELVERLAEYHLAKGQPAGVKPTDEERKAWSEALALGTVPKKSVDEKLAARHALAFAAEANPQDLEAVMNAGRAEGFLLTTGVLLAAVVILKTEVKIEKDANGKWTVLVHKREVSDGLVKSFVKSVLGLG